MGLFDKFKNKEVSVLKEQEDEVRMTEKELKEHHAYMMKLKTILNGLSDIDKKYVHLAPSLKSPRTEDGKIDYSKMSDAYKQHLKGLEETVTAIHNFSRIPSMINTICGYVEKDSRRLDKNDCLAIRRVINEQLDKLESLCATDYDYNEGIKRNREKYDSQLDEVREELKELDYDVTKIKESKTFG